VSDLAARNARADKAFVVRAALEAGAGAVALADARVDERANARMDAAFARGDFATWNYDAAYAAAATRPEQLLAGARSVVCLAIPYANAPPERRRPLDGRVSNYAWSGDYHREVRRILDVVAAALDARAGAAVTRVVCDTAPLAERAFAERAGLGWIGKHTNLIAPGLGSYVFLGEIVTTLDLEPDAPLKKTCGSCTRCIPACPTGALRGDYTIDATRCISDLTQRTGPIPRELRALLGDWVWGCDLCQEVCPPTRGAASPVTGGLRSRDAAAESFRARDAAAAFPDLVALLELRGEEFDRKYARAAMGWRGAAVLRRNAAVALGNALDRSAVVALERSLRGDRHPLVRGHAAWALGRIGSPRALAALRARLRAEQVGSVRAEIENALQAWETFPSRPALKSAGEHL
jgi:epoxyqueuosine reductase